MLASIGVYDLLFVAPRWSLKPADPQSWVAFGVMLGVGLLVSRLAVQGREQAAVAEARARRAQALSELSMALTRARTLDEIRACLVEAVQRSLGTPACVLLDDGRGADLRPPSYPLEDVDASVARRTMREAEECNADTAGATAGTLRYVPLVADTRALGVLVLRLGKSDTPSHEDHQLARALANQAATALDRAHHEALSAAAALEAERERLRSTLLAGISHDFRTPLTTIVGNATTLIEQGERCAPQQRRALLSDLLDEAQRLHQLASNLLDLTRLEEGAVRPSFEWCPTDELVQEALEATRRLVSRHDVQVRVAPDDLVWCDPRLIVQVLANLLENAARHTPAGGRILVEQATAAERWSMAVHDSGPGVPAGQETLIFRKFHRAGGADDTAGKGLGLAICAAVAQLHGGTITVGNDGGARFVLCLPLPRQLPRANGVAVGPAADWEAR